MLDGKIEYSHSRAVKNEQCEESWIMKKNVFILIGIIAFSAAAADSLTRIGAVFSGSPTSTSYQQQSFDNENTWRNVRGEKKFASKDNGWMEYYGTVVEVFSEGCYLLHNGTGSSGQRYYIAVTNHPQSRVDGEYVKDCLGIYVGNTKGKYDSMTVKMYDYGKPWVATAEEKKRAAEIAEKNAVVRAEKERIAMTNAFKFQFQQASNGYASAQYSVGKRYLTGDGVSRDTNQARYWLEKSAAQNDVLAKKALAELGN